jgi:hypothetical protein
MHVLVASNRKVGPVVDKSQRSAFRKAGWRRWQMKIASHYASTTWSKYTSDYQSISSRSNAWNIQYQTISNQL